MNSPHTKHTLRNHILCACPPATRRSMLPRSATRIFLKQITYLVLFYICLMSYPLLSTRIQIYLIFKIMKFETTTGAKKTLLTSSGLLYNAQARRWILHVDLISFFVYDTENNHFPPSRSIVLFVFFFSTTKLEGENQ
jgi:hypothetical protein